jgi:hypothetical protein
MPSITAGMNLAAKLAKEIIDSKKYSLYPVYEDLFNYKGSKVNNEFHHVVLTWQVTNIVPQSHSNTWTSLPDGSRTIILRANQSIGG